MGQKELHSIPAKLLLFGEYLVLSGGNAFSVPLPKFRLEKTIHEKSNKDFFGKLASYIKTTNLANRLSEKFEFDIEHGLHYDSNIPIGYGLGSSGALTAAIYRDYISPQSADPNVLITELAAIENFFHDSSSGLDPITSYYQKPIIIRSGKVSIANDIHLDKFYLFDSGIKRNAKLAIQHFKAISVSAEFQLKLKKLIELNNLMIESIISQKSIDCEIKGFSELQFELFFDFIPEFVIKKWEHGLQTDSYYMKLCGAGMGGMFLVYASNPLPEFIALT